MRIRVVSCEECGLLLWQARARESWLGASAPVMREEQGLEQ